MNHEKTNEPDKSADQHEYDHDGIVELDNRLPNWWLFILFGSIVFSLGYWYYYHTFESGGLSSQAALAKEQAETELKKPKLAITNEALLALSKDPIEVKKGLEIYKTNCVACHGANAEGTAIGPNLTDEFWLHGGKPSQIFTTIQHGVPEKGMLAWETVLGNEKIKSVVAFMLTLKNTNFKGGKAPQGEKEN